MVQPHVPQHKYYISFTFFLSHSAHYFIFLCAYFYIILTQAMTFLVCKD